MTPTWARCRVSLIGLEGNRRLCPVAPLETGQRAVTGAFLLDHGLDEGARGGLEADPPEGIERKNVFSQTDLHVACPAAVHPTIRHARFKWQIPPHVERPDGNHVDIAVEDERAASRRRGPV